MKGIIMAGGAGSRLRPLTCDLPKPMVPVMNRPVMHYGVKLLERHGVKDIGVTLQYLPKTIQDYFGDGSQYNVNLHYFIEESPLGTAGSVKNAQSILDETFIVISGDALTDIDLSRALDFHRRNNSIATLVLKRVNIPLEYGVVVTNQNDEITRFLEKPGWGEVFSDTVNTGIYILEPEVLDYFEPEVKFDFSKDLFPMLLRDKKPMYGYITEEYWCDIGDIGSYLQSHIDVMEGNVGIDLDARVVKENIWTEDGVFLHPEAEIQGPCYIGRNSRIEEGAKINPFTVIGENNSIGKYTNIKKSILWNHNILGMNSEIRGSILCNNVRVGHRVSIFEGSAIGEDTYLRQGVTLKPDVKIWPGKVIEEGVIVDHNVIWGTRLRKTFFGKDGIKGYFNTEINPWFASRLGSAYGTELGEGSRICLSSDHNNASAMLKHSLMAGILSSGLEIIDLGSLITPVARYAVRYLGLEGGIHIRCEDDDPEKVHINLFDKVGANLPDSLERKLENIFISGDFSLKPPIKINKVNVIKDMGVFYIRNLINSVQCEAIKEGNFKILLGGEDRYTNSFFYNIAKELDLHLEMTHGSIADAILMDNYDFALEFQAHGEALKLYDKKGMPIGEGVMTALVSLLCLEQDRDIGIVIPYTAPLAIEEMAKAYESSVIRSKTKKRAIMEEVIRAGDSNRRQVMERFSLYFDGLAMVMGIMDLMAREDKELSELIEDIPKFYMSIRNIECPWETKGKVMRSLIDDAEREENNIELYEGIKVNKDRGWALVLPDSDEPLVRVYSEGMTEEYAEELSKFYEDKINQIKGR